MKTPDEVRIDRLTIELWNHVQVFQETDALDALVYLASRLAKGHRAYGPLNLKDDPRNWPLERLEESSDRVIYTMFEDLQTLWKQEGRKA